MRKSYNMNIRNIFLGGLKLLPIIMSFALSCFIVLYDFNSTNYTFINNISGTSITTSFIIYATAQELGFCAMHKTFIVYDTITSIWIDVRSIIKLKITYWIGNLLVIAFALFLYWWVFRFLIKKSGYKSWLLFYYFKNHFSLLTSWIFNS